MLYIRRKTMERLAAAAFPVYILGVLYFTFLWGGGGFTGTHTLRLNLIPLSWLWEPLLKGEPFRPWQAVLNVLLFLPLGVLLPLRLPGCRKRVLLTSATAATLCIELLQPFFGRCTDIDDVLLNVLGALLGYVLYKRLAGLWGEMQPLPSLYSPAAVFPVSR